MSELEDVRSQKYADLLRRKPKPGHILREKNGFFVPVVMQNRDNGQTVMFVNVIVDDDATGWYLHTRSFGLKAMIMQESHQAVIDMNKGITPMLVDALRVIRLNESKTALICELVQV